MLYNFIDFNNHQPKFIKIIKGVKKVGLFLGMSAGKTVISLTAAKDLLGSGDVKKILVIAPLRVANMVWKQEAEKWSHLKDMNIEICTGTAPQRKANLEKIADIHVINRENIPSYFYWGGSDGFHSLRRTAA